MSVRFEDVRLVTFAETLAHGELTVTGTRDGVTYGCKSGPKHNASFLTGNSKVDDYNLYICGRILRHLVQNAFDKLDGFTVPQLVDDRKFKPTEEQLSEYRERVRPRAVA